MLSIRITCIRFVVPDISYDRASYWISRLVCYCNEPLHSIHVFYCKYEKMDRLALFGTSLLLKYFSDKINKILANIL